jgi:antirestriction protein ArdC
VSQKVYQIITDRILEQLKKGVIPWKKPWKAGDETPRNFISKKPYRGINYLLLSNLGYKHPYYLTYKQAVSKGEKVRKGEKGYPIVFWKFIRVEDEDTGRKKNVPMLRYYTVFNIEQCDDISLPQVDGEEKPEFTPIEQCERVVKDMQNPPAIRENGGDQAVYFPSRDEIEIPKREQFNKPERFYSVLFHELSHSTGHQKRLNRTFGTSKSHKDKTYSKEELVAEMGASFLCGHCGIDTETVEDSASYIKSWLTAFQDDPKMVVSCAGKAQKAADYVLNIKFENKDDDNE